MEMRNKIAGREARTETTRSNGDLARREACPRPIKVHLPGAKTITFDAGASHTIPRRCSFVSLANHEKSVANL